MCYRICDCGLFIRIYAILKKIKSLSLICFLPLTSCGQDELLAFKSRDKKKNSGEPAATEIHRSGTSTSASDETNSDAQKNSDHSESSKSSTSTDSSNIPKKPKSGTPQEEPTTGAHKNPTPCPSNAGFECEMSLFLLNLVNEERILQKVPPLAWSRELGFGAFSWSQTQSEQGAISHSGFPVDRLRVIKQEYGSIPITLAAENVGYIYAPSKNSSDWNGKRTEEESKQIATQFFDMWRKSPGHYRNMIAPTHKTVGIGLIPNGPEWFGTQIFGP